MEKISQFLSKSVFYFSGLVSKADIFLISNFVFISSIFLSSFYLIDRSLLYFILFLGIIILLYSFVAIKSNRRPFIILAIILIVFSFAQFRFDLKNERDLNNELIANVGKRSVVTGVIVEESIDKGSFRQYVIETKEKDRILVRATLYPEFKYGDEVKFTGKLIQPKNFETNTGVFDYVSYLSKSDIYLILSYADGDLISENNGNLIKEKLFKIKNTFIFSLEKNISEPGASLLSGILLGVDNSIGEYWENVFRQVGIIHIIVLSGYNITLVIDSLYWVLSKLKFLKRRVVILIETIGIVLFVIMVGAGPSVVRAGAMASLVLLARATGRTYLAARALVLTATLMILWNPKVLVFDTGFQLSFLATIAIIWISPVLKSALKFIPERFSLKDIASDTLATQIFVLPLLIHKTGLISLISPVSNILVLPIIPITMFFGFLSGILGLISGVIALPFSIIAEFLLMYVLKISEFMSTVPLAFVNVYGFSVWLMVSAYVLYFLVYIKLKNKKALS